MNEDIRCLMVGDGTCEMEDLVKNHLKGRHTTPLLIEKVLAKQPLVLPIDRHNLEVMKQCAQHSSCYRSYSLVIDI